MSLFSRLLNLNTGSIPLEDFFTEIVAYLFESDKVLLLEWINHLSLFETDNFAEISIDTQRSYSRLDNHFSDSRPDMVIELSSETQTSTIFIESKVGSSEGFEQLSRYAEILSTLNGLQNKVVLYITRDYDPKDAETVLRRVPGSDVLFKQLRWYEFFLFLKVRNENNLVQEVLSFMEKYRMARNNCFSPLDVLALNNFPNSLKLMEETLWGRVKDEFSSVVAPPKSKKAALMQLQWHGRYIMHAGLPHNWWCGLGFALNSKESSDYPRLVLMIEINPSSPRREEILIGMKKICESNDQWYGYNLNISRAWSGIVLEKSLQAFLGTEDHVASMQDFFLGALGQLSEIKCAYPELPWTDV